MSNLVLYSIPAFIALIVLELLWAKRHPEAVGYEPRDTVASLSMGLANVMVSAGAKLLSIPFFAWVYQHRVLELGQPTLWWSWLVLLASEDFCYYWFHRSHHEVRVLWAVHVNHHSSEHYNLSTALRQALLTPLTGPIFWAPLALVGYPPWMILTAQAWSLLYQFWLHTEAIGKLGPLEYIFNTPSHHRVHHGKNVRYLDRNHAGIFIVWDRLFGTFAPERERVVYGLTKDIHTFNLVKIGFHELVAIAGDVRRAPTLRAKLGYIFAPPGWSHDGSTLTAGQLHKQLRASSSL
ncbi:MAG TPA: sterol desaturase family protein [Kofleriaceae bacterium]|nr:sterol desaturase family protein [Kofleriaceae bacterium]